MTQWTFHHPRVTHEWLGLLPAMLSESDPRPAREQLHSGYAHGGGWQPFKGFKLNNGENPSLSYPGDPPMRALAETRLRDERIVLFESSWVAVIQPDMSFEVSRMD